MVLRAFIARLIRAGERLRLGQVASGIIMNPARRVEEGRRRLETREIDSEEAGDKVEPREVLMSVEA